MSTIENNTTTTTTTTAPKRIVVKVECNPRLAGQSGLVGKMITETLPKIREKFVSPNKPYIKYVASSEESTAYWELTAPEEVAREVVVLIKTGEEEITNTPIAPKVRSVVECCEEVKRDPKKVGTLISVELPKIRSAFSQRPYIKYENGQWDITAQTSTIVDEVISMIREAEKATIGVKRTVPSDCSVGAVKKILSNIKSLHRPNCLIKYNPDRKEWQFKAPSEQALETLIDDWKALVRECTNPQPIRKVVHFIPNLPPREFTWNDEDFPQLNGTA